MQINCLKELHYIFKGFCLSHFYLFLYYKIKMVSSVKLWTLLIKYFERNIDVIMILTISVSHVWTSFLWDFGKSISISILARKILQITRSIITHTFFGFCTREMNSNLILQKNITHKNEIIQFINESNNLLQLVVILILF